MEAIQKPKIGDTVERQDGERFLVTQIDAHFVGEIRGVYGRRIFRNGGLRTNDTLVAYFEIARTIPAKPKRRQ